jgi:MYXO-CTERM domain-containing protein
VKTFKTYVSALTPLAGLALLAAPASALIVPDNGAGTATIPPPTGVYNWDGISPPWAFSAGLPPLSDVHSTSTQWGTFAFGTDLPGGALGGNHQTFTAPLAFQFVGTGAFLGYTRNLSIAMAGQTDTAPRGAPFSSPQFFATDVTNLQGQITSDPDFDLFRITGGTNFGMPGPGQTTLTASGSSWQVDSFFDIMYRIDFIGRPGGPFGGMSGSTTGTVRMIIGTVPAPASAGLLALAALTATRRRRT